MTARVPESGNQLHTPFGFGFGVNSETWNESERERERRKQMRALHRFDKIKNGMTILVGNALPGLARRGRRTMG